ncbi:NAD(P)H-hydrate dehydratase [Fluviicola sp.]|uniref:NAD(P)H-hydrate dehydratase n=1 Tax=Fluviicola sp. TaxID=1917219 RepID=UPI0031D52D26
MNKLTKNYIGLRLKQRETFSHKGDHGHALLIAGKKGMMGTAVIAAKAGLRAGAGLLTVCVPTEERFMLQTAVPEAMLLMREEGHYQVERFSAVGVGPGIGTDELAEEMLVSVLVQAKTPVLLDADALTIISHNKKLLDCVPEGTVLTPHAGEFDRLFGEHTLQEDRIQTAKEKSAAYGIIIVLKGHHTAIIKDQEVVYNTTGNAGLAKGGSGDALTGIITSFLAQGYEPFDAAKLGVYLHGLAADITLAEQSAESMLITDVIANLGKAFKQIRE